MKKVSYLHEKKRKATNWRNEALKTAQLDQPKSENQTASDQVNKWRFLFFVSLALNCFLIYQFWG